MSSNSTRMCKRRSQWIRKFQSLQLSPTKCLTIVARRRQCRCGPGGVEGNGRKAERCFLNEPVAESHLLKEFLTFLRYKPLGLPCSLFTIFPTGPRFTESDLTPHLRAGLPTLLLPAPALFLQQAHSDSVPQQNPGFLSACFPPNTPTLSSRSDRRLSSRAQGHYSPHKLQPLRRSPNVTPEPETFRLPYGPSSLPPEPPPRCGPYST